MALTEDRTQIYGWLMATALILASTAFFKKTDRAITWGSLLTHACSEGCGQSRLPVELKSFSLHFSDGFRNICCVGVSLMRSQRHSFRWVKRLLNDLHIMLSSIDWLELLNRVLHEGLLGLLWVLRLTKIVWSITLSIKWFNTSIRGRIVGHWLLLLHDIMAWKC